MKEDNNRMQNLHHSIGAKKGWLRHHSNYMRGMRKKSRDNMNKTFYQVAKEIEETMNEVKIQKNDIFDLKCEIICENLSGGFSFSINKDTGEVSFSTLLNESGHGNYKQINQTSEDYTALYEDLKEEFTSIASTVDQSIKQILAKHGLSET